MQETINLNLGIKKSISLGSWITLAHPAIAEIMAKAGFEWLVVDLEHSTITIRETEELIRVIDLCGSKAFVRLTANNPNQIKRVLDAGAHGIIVHMINTPDDAEKAANAMFYPPKGTRGVGLARAQGYGSEFSHYLKKQSLLQLIVQIEHITAVENLESILSHPCVNGFIVGPYDLSASMHIPGEFKNNLFQSTLRKIENIAKKYPWVKKGFHLVEPDMLALEKLIQDNYNFIAYSVDIRLLDVHSRSAVKQFTRMAT